MESGRIPAGGARAAHVLLDAVVSQSTGQTVQANVDAMTIALSSLTIDSPDSPEIVPTPGDIVGSAVVCISWLTTRLAASSGRDIEDVIVDLRAFLDSVSGPGEED
ncbi:hypothetical protein [Herbiconiux ginsengi]|uniref:Uncharacterized protein n=1 Tax=Herbiconiux ginsengi TaxID=381665 RepID=A0A1H3U515_9MICO|nr:hypothetical protein [Herbiconiux ginsengi]SDZ57566.1 hypothetical protein SAMN05216554_0144 [Herbiconiux ginsengi]